MVYYMWRGFLPNEALPDVFETAGSASTHLLTSVTKREHDPAHYDQEHKKDSQRAGDPPRLGGECANAVRDERGQQGQRERPICAYAAALVMALAAIAGLGDIA